VIGPGRWVAQGPLQVRPCKLGRRIHAAHAPAQPTCPTPDSFRVRPATEKKKNSRSGSRAALARIEPSMASALQETAGQAAFAFDLLFLFRGWQTAEISQRAAGLGSRGCPRHGCRGQASRDGFTASPANPTRPTHLRLLHSATNHTHPRGAAPLAETPVFVSRKLKIRKHSAAIPQSSACNRSSLVFVTFQSAWSR